MKHILINSALLALVVSCASPGTPKGPFPKEYKAKVPLYLYRETKGRDTVYWFDSAKWDFLPDNDFYAQIAYLPKEHRIKVIRVHKPIEFLHPADFKVQFQVQLDTQSQLNTEMWMTTSNFYKYFSDS